MDIRPIGFAVWIASVITVAACSPRAEDRMVSDFGTTAANDARTAAAKPGDAARGDTSAMGAAGASTAAAPPNDAQITARVQAELAAARDLSGARIDVDTRDGVVTLSGPVRTAAVKARASEIARSVREVRQVNDQLTLVMG